VDVGFLIKLPYCCFNEIEVGFRPLMLVGA
jgi:hypothetical protein